MTVTINGKLNLDFGLDFIHKEIGEAEAKTYYVDIPLSDGSIDLTESLSKIIRYNNREITMVFEIRKDRTEWAQLMSDLNQEWNGRQVKVVFSDDTEYYWRGRASVGALEDHGFTAGVTLTVNAEPYKRTVAPEIYGPFTLASNTSETVTIANTHVKAWPSFYCSSAMVEVTYDGDVWGDIGFLEHTFYGLELPNGLSTITLTNDWPASTDVYIEVEGGEL